MAMPAINNLIKLSGVNEIIIFGSYISTQLFINDKRISKILVDESKKAHNRYMFLYEQRKEFIKLDLAVSFRSSFASKFLLFFSSAKKKYNFKKINYERHQVLKYNDFINNIFKSNLKVEDLHLEFEATVYSKPTLGLNPGSTYGSAKRWYPEEFAKVAIEISKTHDIIIFGGPNEIDIAKDIEKRLLDKGIKNYKNLAGKTTIPELIEKIAALDIFITNDSGPMHIAAVYKVKTFAIFGPTSFIGTNQWNNPLEMIISKHLECSPCMKKTCPLKHHDCMKTIRANDILKLIYLEPVK